MDTPDKTLRLKLLFFSIVISFASISNAAVIKGRITEADTHKPVSGAAINIIGTNNTTVSDARGYYIFNKLKSGSYNIIVSCMGFKNSESKSITLVTDDAVAILDISLDPRVIQMNEVVVQGTQNKETNSSARTDERISSNIVSIISAKTIEALPDLTVANVLQRVSGVSMMKNSSGKTPSWLFAEWRPDITAPLSMGQLYPPPADRHGQFRWTFFPLFLLAV
jgi:hypothetical protein